MVPGEAGSSRLEAQRGKKNLWSQELQVSFPYNFRTIYLTKPVWSWCARLFSLTLTAEIWCYGLCVCDAWSFKYIKSTEVSWEVHALYVFRSQQYKKNFRSATLLLLYQVKLNAFFSALNNESPRLPFQMGHLARSRLFLGDKPINQAQHYKYLGVLIDANLNFKQHVDKLLVKVSKRIGVLVRIRNNLTVDAANKV